MSVHNTQKQPSHSAGPKEEEVDYCRPRARIYFCVRVCDKQNHILCLMIIKIATIARWDGEASAAGPANCEWVDDKIAPAPERTDTDR